MSAPPLRPVSKNTAAYDASSSTEGRHQNSERKFHAVVAYCWDHVTTLRPAISTVKRFFGSICWGRSGAVAGVTMVHFSQLEKEREPPYLREDPRLQML